MPTRTVEEFGNRVQIESTKPELSVFENAVAKDGCPISLGDVLGKITSGGMLRRRTRSTVKTGGDFSTAAATGKIVDASKYFKAGDVLKILTAVLQQETATVAGTIGGSGAGNATVVVTSALLPGGSKTFSVAVANNDTAAQVAGKIRTALAADALIDEYFVVSGSSTAVILTVRTAAAYDTTLNISVDNGTCSGLTTAATSANTTPGNAVGATLGTVDSISGDNVTLTGNASINAAAGAIVTGSDGSETAVGISNADSDGDGDTNISLCIGGYLSEAQLTGLDSSAKTDLAGRSTPGGTFRF